MKHKILSIIAIFLMIVIVFSSCNVSTDTISEPTESSAGNTPSPESSSPADSTNSSETQGNKETLGTSQTPDSTGTTGTANTNPSGSNGNSTTGAGTTNTPPNKTNGTSSTPTPTSSDPIINWTSDSPFVVNSSIYSTYKSPSVPKAAYKPKTIILLSEPSYPTSLTLTTLQGIAANTSSTQILIQQGAYSQYSAYMDGVTVSKKDNNNKTWTTWSLLSAFKGKINGYILCDNDKNSDSVKIAIALCKQLNAVAVTKSGENNAKKAGLSCVLDVTGKKDSWLKSSTYFSKLNTKVAIEQTPDLFPKLADYSAMTGAYVNFYSGSSESAHQTMFNMLKPGGIVFGYNNALGEYNTVHSFSTKNISMVPADHSYNLSTLSAFRLESISQKTAAVSSNPPKTGKHTVTIVMSDGDNVQWFLNNFNGKEWFGSPSRGNFNMGWGLPTMAIDLASPMMKYCYDKMTTKDNFIMQLSGLGYTFPSKWTDASAKEKMAQDVADYMKRSDVSVLEILDDYGQNVSNFSKASNFDVFTKQSAIKGILYIDYGGHYNALKGATVWSNGKPVVSARYSLWANGNNNYTPVQIATSIKSASKDPTKINSYSFVIVHAWSGMKGSKFEGNGNTMEAIQLMVNEISKDSNVDIVTPDEFINRVTKNVTH